MAADHRPLIVHVVYRFDVGGLENGLVNLMNRLPVQSWRHAVLSLTEVAPSLAGRVTRSDVNFIELRKGPGHLFRHFAWLRATLRRLSPSIVHTRNLAALEATVPALLAGVRSRVHGEHGRDATDPDGLRRRYRWVRRAYSPLVTRYVALSEDLETYLHDRVGIATQRIVRIHNGVDTQRFRPAAAATVGTVAIAGCPFDRAKHWLVGAVGRMDAIKDHPNLARAFVQALHINPAAARNLRLVLVGDGAMRSQTEQILATAGAGDLVWFAGERTDVADIMRGLDCFVLPSRGEGISNTILEAMASGLPVVATHVGGNSELVEDGLTGRLVPAAQPQALAEAMLYYQAQRTTARRHGTAGRSRAERSFSLDGMVRRYHELYLSELQRAYGPDASLAPKLPTAEG
jgi:sugar transferase (PEP-CTERM/EpsH1 system associated)